MSTTIVPKVTQEIQQTILSNPKINKVYFDTTGRAYFNVHKLRISKDDETEKLFGQGTLSHKREVKISQGGAIVDSFFEEVYKGIPESEIVATLSRKEALEAQVETVQSGIVGQVASMSEEEKSQLLHALLPKEVVDALLSKTTSAPPPPPKPVN